MLNMGNVNVDNTNLAANDLIKITDPVGGRQTLSPSSFSAPSSGVLQSGTIYSAAGTPLPAAAVGLAGSIAVVKDATSPTLGGAYASGGAVWSLVLCTGTSWVTV